MVKNSTIIGLGLSIVIFLGSIVYSIVRYRKSKHVFSSVLWGILSYLATQVLVSLCMSVIVGIFFKDEAAFVKFIQDGNPILSIGIGVSIYTITLFGAALLVTVIQMKREKYHDGSSEVTGVAAGVASLFIPYPIILAYLNYFMGAFAINAGQPIMTPNETVTQAMIDAQVKAIIDLSGINLVISALSLIVTILLFRIMYIFVGAGLRDKQIKVKAFGLAIGIAFLTYVGIQVVGIAELGYVIKFGIIAVLIVLLFYCTRLLEVKKAK